MFLQSPTAHRLSILCVGRIQLAPLTLALHALREGHTDYIHLNMNINITIELPSRAVIGRLGLLSIDRDRLDVAEHLVLHDFLLPHEIPHFANSRLCGHMVGRGEARLVPAGVSDLTLLSFLAHDVLHGRNAFRLLLIDELVDFFRELDLNSIFNS